VRAWFVIFVFLAAAPLKAQDTAIAYYDQCVGAAYERQARAKYEEQVCQSTSSCSAFDAEGFAAEIEKDCVSISVEICVISDTADQCVRDILARLDERTAALVEDFPQERVEAAAEGKQSLQARSLLLMLERSPSPSLDQCLYSASRLRAFAALGVSEATVCQVPMSLLANSLAHLTAERTIALEALEK